MSLTKLAANWKTELLGSKGHVPDLSRTISALLGGGAISGAATPVVANEDWRNANLAGKAGLVFNNALLGAAGAATGHDRFGIAGGLGGLGLANAVSAATSRLKPQDEDMKSWLLRALAEGGKASVSGSLLLSSLLKGGGGRRLIGKYLPKDIKDVIHQDAARQGISLDEQVGKPGTVLSKLLGNKEQGSMAKIYDYMGAPNMAESSMAHGQIQNIPAGEYLSSHAKDMAGGLAAHIPLLPFMAAGGMIGHRNEEEMLKQTDYPAYIRLKLNQLKDRALQ